MGHLEVFDPRTGEIHGLVAQPNRRRHPMGSAWYIVDGRAYMEALVALGGHQRGVYAALPSFMVRGNWLHVVPKDLAETLRISPATVYRALQRMHDIGVLAEVNGGRQFSPYIAWIGAQRDIHLARKLWDQAIQRRIKERQSGVCPRLRAS